MGISFNQIPSDRLVPFLYAEFDNTRAVQGAGILSYRNLIIGNRTSAGSIAAGVPKLISSKSQGQDFFGPGSLLSDMINAFKDNNDTGELWAVALDDSGAKASGNFTFAGTALEDGTVFAYIAGNRVKIDVVNGDTAANVATAFGVELAKLENQTIPANYSVLSGALRLVAKNAGSHGNGADLRVNYNEGEKLPSGITCTVNAFAGGTSAPDITAAIAAIGSTQYNIIAHPYLDNANLVILEDELDTRWGPILQNDGFAIGFKPDTFANLVTFAGTRNNPHQSIAGMYKSPTAPWRLAAMIAANMSFYGQIDPARPFQTLKLKGAMAPAITDRFTSAERNILLQYGIATLNIDDAGGVRIERMVTTYVTNPFGAPDISYRDANTLLTLSYIRWDWRNYILNKYPRHKLASDGTRFDVGQKIMTPKLMKSEAVLKFTQWEKAGLVEGLAQFKNDLVVERNASDPNRMDVLLPTDLVNQLIVTGTQIQFLL